MNTAPLQDALQLSTEQRKGLLEYRREYLQKLSPLLKQRWELHRLMVTTFTNDKDVGFRTSHAKVWACFVLTSFDTSQQDSLCDCAQHAQLNSILAAWWMWLKHTRQPFGLSECPPLCWLHKVAEAEHYFRAEKQ